MRPGPIGNIHGLPRLEKPMDDVAKFAGLSNPRKHQGHEPYQVLLDGTVVRSAREAAEIIGCTTGAIHAAWHYGRTMVRGHEVIKLGKKSESQAQQPLI